jgi:exodeoxyribonuclease III
MTWNLLNGGTDGADRKRAELHEQVIREVKPEVLLVQEARGFLDDGQRLLFESERRWGLRGFVGCAPDTGQHTGVFIHPELVPLSFRVDSVHFHHAASVLTVAVPGAPAPLTLVSVHLCPSHPDARRMEVAHLAGLVSPGQLVVVGGDCNSPSPDDPNVDLAPLPAHFRVRYLGRDGDADRGAIQVLLDAGFIELVGDERPTVPTAAFPGVEFVPFRADHLFVTAQLGDHAVARVVVDERTDIASDHYPVVGELRTW